MFVIIYLISYKNSRLISLPTSSTQPELLEKFYRFSPLAMTNDPTQEQRIDYELQLFWHPQLQSSIADVANSKRHQQLDEILIILTHTVQEIIKVVCKKIYVRNACIYRQAYGVWNVCITASVCCQTGLR